MFQKHLCAKTAALCANKPSPGGRTLISNFRLNEKVILITGASSGIGEAAARAFSAEGAKVMLAARREDRLKKLAAELNCSYTVADVRTDAGALVKKTLATFGRIDVLVNNAGLGYYKNFSEQSWEQTEETIAVNLTGALSVVHHVLPVMLKQNSGTIVNVSSVLGKRPMAGFASYCATKYALHGFSDSLRKELKNTGIRVCHFCPRATATEFFEKPIPGADSAEKVAKALIHTVVKQKSEHIMSLTEKFFIKFRALFN
ncbi:MAG: SDR family NAD(P)-dependent oxidoreductase [Pseudobdellovibrio sp.]